MRPFYVICVLVEFLFAIAAMVGGLLLVRAGYVGMAVPAFFFSVALAVFGVYQLFVFFRQIPK